MRRDETGQGRDETRRGGTGRDGSRREETRVDETRQGETRQDKTAAASRARLWALLCYVLGYVIPPPPNAVPITCQLYYVPVTCQFCYVSL